MKINRGVFSRLNLGILILSSIIQNSGACFNGKASTCQTHECSPCSRCNENYVLTPDFFEWQTIDGVQVRVNFGGRCICPKGMLWKVEADEDRYGPFREPLVSEMLRRDVEYVCLDGKSITQLKKDKKARTSKNIKIVVLIFFIFGLLICCPIFYACWLKKPLKALGRKMNSCCDEKQMPESRAIETVALQVSQYQYQVSKSLKVQPYAKTAVEPKAKVAARIFFKAPHTEAYWMNNFGEVPVYTETGFVLDFTPPQSEAYWMKNFGFVPVWTKAGFNIGFLS